MTPNSVRLQLAQDLRELGQLISKLSGIVQDIGPLQKAYDECQRDTGDKFQYSIDNLVFRIGKNKMKPIPKDLNDITVNLSVHVCGPCLMYGGEVGDPLETLEFNLVLTGEHRDAGIKKSVHWAWHLDRDVGAVGGAAAYMHPFYHFQAGGRMLDRSLSYGRSLIMSAPRFAHPPMDAPLGVDFVLTNFIEQSIISDLREDSQYRRILSNSQERFWQPYVSALAKAWQLESSGWKSGVLWPQLIKRR